MLTRNIGTGERSEGAGYLAGIDAGPSAATAYRPEPQWPPNTPREKYDGANAVLIDVYAAARKLPLEEFQDHVFGLLRKVLSFDSGTWGTGSVLARGLLTHSAHHYRCDPNFEREYEPLRHLDDRFQRLRSRGTQAIAVHAPTFFTGKANRPILDLMRRYGRGSSLIAAHFPDESANWVALHRADGGRPFSELETVLLTWLYPHLVEALRVNRAIALQQLKIGEGANFAYAIADAQGVLHDATVDFLPLLRREWPNFSGVSLPRELVSALSADEPTFIGREIAVRHRHHVGLIFLTGRPRGSIDSLSNRELGVARLIAGGLSYKEIARALLLAPATVRNHTQSIHDKLQVRRIAELTRLVVAGDWGYSATSRAKVCS